MKTQNDKQTDKRMSSLLSAVDRQAAAPDKQFLDELQAKSTAEFLSFSADDNKQSEKTIPILIWRIIMKSRIRKLAAAAVILIALLIGMNQFGGSLDMTGVAWGEVANKVEQIDSFIFQQRISTDGIPGGTTTDMELTTYVSSEYGLRQDTYMNGEAISISYIPPTGTIVTQVMPNEKKYRRVSTPEEQMRKIHYQANPKGMIKEFMSFEHTELGRKTIDGVEAEGIEVNDPSFLDAVFERAVGRLWVDVETDLPVRTEIEGVSGNGSAKVKIDAHDFDWDAEPKPSVFEPDIPDDYTLLER
ncbi:MAG: hypothetical protein ACYSWQ_09940 [Planctomycetota bacterium]